MTEKHKELYKSAAAKDDGEKMCYAIAQMLDELEETNPKMYEHCKKFLEDVAYSISKTEAESIVRNMEPRGQKWSYSEISDFLKTKGIEGKCVEYYLVMNMVYNDFYDTAALYGLQKDAEFYFSLSKDFINDPDAKPYKVERYFTYN